jgi:hypothetical protein
VIPENIAATSFDWRMMAGFQASEVALENLCFPSSLRREHEHGLLALHARDTLYCPLASWTCKIMINENNNASRN